MFKLVERLRQQNVSLEKAAKKTGISVSRLLHIETGSDFSLAEMRKICDVLKLTYIPASNGEPQSKRVQLLFRQNALAEEPSEEYAVSMLSNQIARVVELAAGLPSNLAWLQRMRNAHSLPLSAEQAAFLFRKLFFDDDHESPLLTLPVLATERLGIFLLVVPKLPVEGVSARIGEYAAIFVAPRTFAPRMLFTLAHEIGHFVADHHDNQSDFALYDRAEDIGAWNASRKTNEVFADSFGAALLMPPQAVGITIKTFREAYQLSGPLGDLEICFLARVFGVSFEVAGRRCEQLGLLQKNGARALYEFLKHEHINPEKRADEAGIPARGKIKFQSSSQLVAAAAIKIRAGLLSMGRASETLHISIADLMRANSEMVE